MGEMIAGAAIFFAGGLTSAVVILGIIVYKYPEEEDG